MRCNHVHRGRLPRGLALALVLATTAGLARSDAGRAQTPAAPSRIALGEARAVTEGVTFYRPDAASVPDLPGPLAVQALALDPRAVDLTAALALGAQQGRATVADAARHDGAVAAVNASFFVLATGDPTGVLRVDGRLVSDARLLRGAVAIAPGPPRVRLTFDRVRVRAALEVRAGGAWRVVSLDGVDTVRRAAGVTLYTSRFGPDTGTAAAGVEWPVSFTPGAVVAGTGEGATRIATGRVTDRVEGGRTPIPRDGAVVSFGGSPPPAPLDRLKAGARIRIRETWEAESASGAAAFARADDVVGGAGLLVRAGRPIEDWTPERTGDSLRTVRHPRTMIGTDARGTIWLVTVDGRQPGYSVGLTLPELRSLALGLGLVDALNLDGGGSTTMVVRGEIVNRPSDASGPRTVSDVLLVRPGRGPRPADPR